jgi:hypothetical protein
LKTGVTLAMGVIYAPWRAKKQRQKFGPACFALRHPREVGCGEINRTASEEIKDAAVPEAAAKG